MLLETIKTYIYTNLYVFEGKNKAIILHSLRLSHMGHFILNNIVINNNLFVCLTEITFFSIQK